MKPLFQKYVHDYHWIALNELDYKKTYYWSNTDVNGYMDWGSGTSHDVFYKPTSEYIHVYIFEVYFSTLLKSFRFTFIILRDTMCHTESE